MHISERGLKLIQSFEGCRLEAYQDSVKIWTIGYGHTKGVKKGQKITKEQAIEFLRQDIIASEYKVDRYLDKYNFNQNQYDALVSFAFNIGNIDQLTSNGSRSISRIGEKMLEYNRAGGRVLEGLTRRRKAENKLYNEPVKTSDVIKQTLEQKTEYILDKNSVVTRKKTIEEVAQMVVDGKYGNGHERKSRLKKAGYDYQEVQNAVNKILADRSKVKTYTIQKGDTLTSIARKYNTTVKELQAKNNISNPNKIYEGKKIYV